MGNVIETGLSTDSRTGMLYENYGDSNSTFVAYTNILAVGKPMYVFYGYKVDGIVQTYTEGVEAGLSGDFAQPGEFKYVDIDGNNTVDERDRCIIGDPNPDWSASLGIDVSWKRFDFSVFLMVYLVVMLSICQASTSLTIPIFAGLLIILLMIIHV